MPTVALPSISAAIFSTALGSTLRKLSWHLWKNGVIKIVVACKDFTSPGIVLQDFASLKNTVIDSGHSGYGTELSDIMRAMEDQTAFPPALLQQHFWNVFIVDALIGNWDRHNGNWGFLYNTTTDEIAIAPVYDCGSCLYPQADEAIMRDTIDKQSERVCALSQSLFPALRSMVKKSTTLILFPLWRMQIAAKHWSGYCPKSTWMQFSVSWMRLHSFRICKSSSIRQCCGHGKSASLILQWKNCGKWKGQMNLTHGNK